MSFGFYQPVFKIYTDLLERGGNWPATPLQSDTYQGRCALIFSHNCELKRINAAKCKVMVILINKQRTSEFIFLTHLKQRSNFILFQIRLNSWLLWRRHEETVVPHRSFQQEETMRWAGVIRPSRLPSAIEMCKRIISPSRARVSSDGFSFGLSSAEQASLSPAHCGDSARDHPHFVASLTLRLSGGGYPVETNGTAALWQYKSSAHWPPAVLTELPPPLPLPLSLALCLALRLKMQLCARGAKCPSSSSAHVHWKQPKVCVPLVLL